MVNEPRKKIHIDPTKKRELADKLPELVGAMLLEEPDQMDVNEFLDHMSLLERLAKRLGKREAVSGSVTFSLIISFAVLILTAPIYQGHITIIIPATVISILKAYQIPTDFLIMFTIFIAISRKPLASIISSFFNSPSKTEIRE